MGLWSGRFSDDPHAQVVEFTQSVSFDQRLYAHDIRGSIAHVRMLAATGIIPPQEATRIVSELGRIRDEIEGGTFTFTSRSEDVHMAIEQCLIDRLGDVGARLHAARSRNDQVATDIRLYLRDEIREIQDRIRDMQRSLVDVAVANDTVIMPGYTHLQRAQPILMAHHLLAYVEMLDRDYTRLTDCATRMNVLPLGSAALAGTTLPIDRERVADELGFEGVSRNSMDAVSDRDFMIELLAALSTCMMHLSRLSEDLIFWSSAECGFVDLPDAFCTGSSIMPQKKNPDVAELVRGKTGRVYGSLVALLTTLKGLPLTYNRDLQEDKEPLFDAIDTVKSALGIYALMISGINIRAEITASAAADPLLMATDLAEWLVANKVPFRLAHAKVGQLIAYCIRESKELNTLSLDEMRTIIPEATDDCLNLFDPQASVRSRNSSGGTSPGQVASQLAYWTHRLQDPIDPVR